MTVVLRYACLLTLACLVSLLVSPEGAQGEELQLQPSPPPKVPKWLRKFGQLNKYVKNFFSGSAKKSKNHQKDSPIKRTESPPIAHNVTTTSKPMKSHQ